MLPSFVPTKNGYKVMKLGNDLYHLRRCTRSATTFRVLHQRTVAACRQALTWRELAANLVVAEGKAHDVHVPRLTSYCEGKTGIHGQDLSDQRSRPMLLWMIAVNEAACGAGVTTRPTSISHFVRLAGRISIFSHCGTGFGASIPSAVSTRLVTPWKSRHCLAVGHLKARKDACTTGMRPHDRWEGEPHGIGCARFDMKICSLSCFANSTHLWKSGSRP